MPKTAAKARHTHLIATLNQGERTLGYQTLDLAGNGCPPLIKELAYRAVANFPELAGSPWQLAVEMDSAGRETAHSAVDGTSTADGRPGLRLEAWADDPRLPRLAAISVPVKNLAWIGLAMARQLGVDPDDFGNHTFCLQVIEPDHPTVQEAASAGEDDDFAFEDASRPRLRLPQEFSTEPPFLKAKAKSKSKAANGAPRRVLSGTEVANRWIRCVFSHAVWRQFLAAAEAETEVERAFGAPMRVHLVEGVCYLVVREPLTRLPAVAARSHLTTRGKQLYELHRRFHGQFAYLHLHPPTLSLDCPAAKAGKCIKAGKCTKKEVAMTPSPSGPDLAVALNLDASTPLPVLMPIALWGTKNGSVAAHTFSGGILSKIALEVGGV